jgi:DNA-binding NarL/FixJ family response regulator
MHSKIKVLLVDDSRVFLKAATGFLRTEPELDIVGALADAGEALEQIGELQPHVVLTDLNMPGMTGLELITRLRVRMPHVAIIAVTLLSSPSYRQAAFLAGADGFVAKDTLVSDLLPAIKRSVYPRQARASTGPLRPMAAHLEQMNKS